MNKKKVKSNKDIPMTSRQLVLITSIVGALLWGGFHGALYFFNFSEVSLYQIKGWFGIGKLENNWMNFAVTVLLMCLISYAISNIYYYLLRKQNNFGVFLGFGVAIFILFFVILQPLNNSIPPITKLSSLTNVTNICFCVLYGVFVAYSISFDYAQRKYLENRSKQVDLQKDL